MNADDLLDNQYVRAEVHIPKELGDRIDSMVGTYGGCFLRGKTECILYEGGIRYTENQSRHLCVPLRTTVSSNFIPRQN